MIMTATIKLLSMLISLAMMLTGTYGAEAPEAASRTLTLSNVVVTVNGETVKLSPSVSLGASSEAGKALYDVAMNLNGRKLFPVQVAVTEQAVTALVENANTAVTVPAEAIDSLVGNLANSAVSSSDPEALAIVKFATGELIPAYAKVLKKVGDTEFQKQMTARSEELLAQVADKGAGEPDVIEIDGDAYDVTYYEYTLTNDQLMELVDLVYTADEDLENLYNALFEFYDMMPEDSGLKGMHSYRDLVEATGVEMTMDVIERRNDDGTVLINDATMTIDYSKALEKAAAMTATVDDDDDDDEDGEDGGTVGVIGGENTVVSAGGASLQPMVIEVHGEKLGERTGSTMHTEYVIQGVKLAIDGYTAQDEDIMTMDLTMNVDGGDEGNMNYTLSGAKTPTSRQVNLDVDFSDDDGEGFDLTGEYIGGAAADAADWTYNLSTDIGIRDDDGNASGSLTVQGENHGDGACHATISMGGAYAGQTAGLVFDADIGVDPIEDVATGHDGLVIDDLNRADEILNEEANQGVLVQIAGSIMTDAGTLMQDESVSALSGLFTRLMEGAASGETVQPDKPQDGETPQEPEATDNGEGSDEIEPDIDHTGTVETDGASPAPEPEDDGVLPYQEPVFGFLPEGMKVLETEVDTAFDSVNISISDDDYENMIYAAFNPQRQGDVATYVMDAEGNLVQPEGKSVQIFQQEAGSWMATVTRNGVTADLYINSQTIDVETIARIIKELEF